MPTPAETRPDACRRSAARTRIAAAMLAAMLAATPLACRQSDSQSKPDTGETARQPAEPAEAERWELTARALGKLERPLSVVFSPDGRHVAYVRNVDPRGQYVQQVVVADGREHETFTKVHMVGYSADSSQLIYGATDAGEHKRVVNGKVVKVYERAELEELARQPQPAEPAQVISRGEKKLVVFDGREGPEYDTISRPVVSPDGRRVAYVGRRGSEWDLVVDGKSTTWEVVVLESLVFSPDSLRLAAVVRKDGKLLVLVDGGTTEAPGVVYGPLVFSPDSRRLGYAAMTGDVLWGHGPWVAVIDGQVSPEYRAVHGFSFSPDSQHVAYSVRRDDGTWAVVHDGKEGPPLEQHPHHLVWSPDSQRLGYLVGQQGIIASPTPPASSHGVVVDGVRISKAWSSDLVFSPDSRHYAFWGYNLVIDGETMQYSRCEGAATIPIAFDLPTSFHTIAQDIQANLVAIHAQWLAPGTTPAAPAPQAGQGSPTTQRDVGLATQEQWIQGIPASGFESVVYGFCDPKTGKCSLRANGAVLQWQLKQDRRAFKFLDVWRYSPERRLWEKLPEPLPRTATITADPKRTVFGPKTDQVLVDLTNRPALYWARWLEEGKLVQMPVFCGRVMPQDYLVAPPPKGMVVAGIPHDNSAEVRYIPDPREFFNKIPAAPAGEGAPATQPDELDAVVDPKSGKVVAFWVQHRDRPEDPVLIEEPYAVLVVWTGQQGRFYLYDAGRKKVFATRDFERFVRRVGQLPEDCRIQRVEKCTVSFSYGMPVEQSRRLTSILSEGDRVLVGVEEKAPFIHCTCESTGLRFPDDPAPAPKASPATQPDVDLPAGVAPTTQVDGWGPVNNGLRARLTSRRGLFVTGERIHVELTLECLKAPDSRSGAQLFPHVFLAIRNGSGRQIKLPIENRLNIRNGASYSRQFDLGEVFPELSKPGKYDVVGGHSNHTIKDIGDWVGSVTSADLRIEVLSDTPENRQKVAASTGPATQPAAAPAPATQGEADGVPDDPIVQVQRARCAENLRAIDEALRGYQDEFVPFPALTTQPAGGEDPLWPGSQPRRLQEHNLNFPKRLLSDSNQIPAPTPGDCAPAPQAGPTTQKERLWRPAELIRLRAQLHSGIGKDVQDQFYRKLDELGDAELTADRAIELFEPLHQARIAEVEWQWLTDMLRGKPVRPCPVPGDQPPEATPPATPQAGPTTQEDGDWRAAIERAMGRVRDGIAGLEGKYPVLKGVKDVEPIFGGDSGFTRTGVRLRFAGNATEWTQKGNEPKAADASKPFCRIDLYLFTPPKPSLQPSPNEEIYDIGSRKWQGSIFVWSDDKALIDAVRKIVHKELDRPTRPPVPAPAPATQGEE